MGRGGERRAGGYFCPEPTAIKRALKKWPEKRERSAYTTDKANKAAEGMLCANCRYPVKAEV